METPDVDVVRFLDATPEMRAADATAGSDTLGTLSGYFSVFNTWYEVNSLWEGQFLERVSKGAFTQTIAEDRAAMRVLFDHGFDSQIGNKVLGTIDTLEERSKGPYYEVPLFDTSYNRDLLPGLRAGAYGASFRMRVLDERWSDEPGPSDHNPKGIPERTILRTQTMEFGPVTFPANPAASAGVRSATDLFYDQLRQRNAPAFEAALRSAGRGPAAERLAAGQPPAGDTTDLTGEPAARSTGRGDNDAGPRSGHVSALLSTDPRTRDRVLRALGVLNA